MLDEAVSSRMLIADTRKLSDSTVSWHIGAVYVLSMGPVVSRHRL